MADRNLESGLGCDDQKLFPKKPPDLGQLQIEPDKGQWRGLFAGHGKGEEGWFLALDLETAIFQRFSEGRFRQGYVVIPEIPVSTRDKLDIGAHDQSAASAQRFVRLVECRAQGSFVRQVLEEIAGENKI